METNDKKSISAAKKRMEKFTKKVTWSNELTNVKLMTPELSKFDNLNKIIFYEEEEENSNEKEDNLGDRKQ